MALRPEAEAHFPEKAGVKNSGMVCVAAGPDDFREKKSQVRLCEPSHLVVAGESSTSLRGHAGLVLDHSDHDAWLTGKVGVELLRPAPNDLLRMWPVSKRVNASGRGGL
jgi:hypothetical protein